MSDHHGTDSDAILTFWFKEAGPEKWYGGGPDFDADIAARFKDIATALADELEREGQSRWEETAKGALAAIIVLDQFARNMFRNKAEAFAWDHLSLALARRTLARGFDMELSPAQRAFVYLPFMHSENIDDQNLCVELMSERVKDESNIYHALEHRKVIQSFGRFPHRNAILGRDSTNAEEQFMAEGGYSP